MSKLLPLLILALITTACLGDDATTTQTVGDTPAPATQDPAPVDDPSTDAVTPEPQRSTPEEGDDNPQQDLPPIVIDQAIGIAGSGVGGGSIELSGTANTFEALILLELLDLQGNVIEAPFTTATCGTGCRGDWTHTFGDLEPGTYTVAAFEDDPSDGESATPPFRVELVVEVPQP